MAVLDGSAPLRKAVLKHFPDARIQRCQVHKERNLKKYLARRDWPELEGYFSRLRKVEGGQAALEVLLELDRFLEHKNKAARESLHEAGLDLIRVHLLDTPATLHVSFLSTNMIENTFRNFRYESGRVNRWRTETDQAMPVCVRAQHRQALASNRVTNRGGRIPSSVPLQRLIGAR